jgi:glycosyltransferase involved in cell wall biosynthesis
VRALHVIPSAAPGDGGPNLAVRAIARGLVSRGIDVTVATTNADGVRTLPVPLETPVIDEGVVYRYFARTVPGSWKFSWPLTRWLWANAGGYDVVHVHALFSYATIPGCRAAAHAPVPYVLEMAAAIHVTSNAEADDVARLGYGDRARVIPLGVAVDDKLWMGARPVATERPLRLLFLSRLHEKKNVPLLLRALANVRSSARDVELTIAGDGDPRYRAELSALTAQLGLGERVRFVGHVDGEEKRRVLSDADCFVLPSAHENFGIAVAEALAAGLPVIVTPGVALAPNVSDAGAGLVADATDDAVAAAIAWAADHPAALVEMGQRAWRLARTDLSWETTCARLSDLYTELAMPRKRQGRPA